MTLNDIERKVITFGKFKSARRAFWLPTLGVAVWWDRSAWDVDVIERTRKGSAYRLWEIAVWPWRIAVWRRKGAKANG